jgi:hypothetical protein
MAEGTKSSMWEPPSRTKMATIYDERDRLRKENAELRAQLASWYRCSNCSADLRLKCTECGAA